MHRNEIISVFNESFNEEIKCQQRFISNFCRFNSQFA